MLMPMRNTLSPLGRAAGAADPRLFYDTFTDTNGVLLPAHTPDYDLVGGGWLTSVGTFDIQGNQARVVGNTSLAHIYVNTGIADATIEMSLTLAAGSGTTQAQGLLLRYSDSDNYIAAGLNQAGGLIVIFDRIAGAAVLRASAVLALSIGVTYNLAASLSGQNISFTVNGGTPLTYSTAFNQSATRHGIYQPRGLARMDNFEVSQ